MPADGVDELLALSKRLKALGHRGLSREFSREIAKVLKPLRTTDLPASALDTLPKKGGLNRKVAKTKYRIQRRTGSRTAGLRLVAKYQYNIRRMDNPGIVRHPVFKRKGEESRRVVWVNQKIEPGWFTKPTKTAQPRILGGMNRAMSHTVAQIEGRERSVNSSGDPLL